MNAHAQALAAYGTATSTNKTPRAVEYDVFARITARMRRAAADGATAFPALAAALTDNRRLWTELALDLASDGNQLPETLRAQLLGLAQFTMRHTDGILSGSVSADDLVEINLAVMRGLKGQGEAS